MKSFLNTSETMLPESLSGFVSAHSDLVSHVEDGNFICRKNPTENKVTLISGGGSGHEPLHCGFVGLGMLDAACPGQMFTSPTPDQIAKAALATEQGAGCVFIVKNYAGDLMNFEMAAEQLEGETGLIVVGDDLASSPKKSTRRGIAGTLIVQKIVGAAAEKNWPVRDLVSLGNLVNQSTHSIGVALNGSFNPITKRRSFSLGADEIEFGVGIHGEPGGARRAMKPAHEIAAEMCAPLLAEIGKDLGRPCLLFINGLGGTPLGELYLVYHSVRAIFEKAGVTIARSLVGNYVTSLNMTGCSITVTSMTNHMLALWDAPVQTPSLRWGV